MVRKTILIVLSITLIVSGYFAYQLNKQFNQIKHVTIDKSDQALGIKMNNLGDRLEEKLNYDKKTFYNDDVVNIALFGLDRRSPEESARSDSIMILTIDYSNKEIKLSSIMRDLRVPIEKHGMDKINHAYSYGGPQLAVKTINQNFGTNIKDFVAVDFDGLKKIIDVYGGVTVLINDNEISYVNQCIANSENYLSKAGKQLLNGEQAVAFSRVRYIGNGDFERTERQRKILVDMIHKTRDSGLSSFPGYVAEIMPHVQTSLDKTTILSLGMKCFKEDIKTLEEERFPLDGYWEDTKISGVYYLSADIDKTKQHIVDFIYGSASKVSQDLACFQILFVNKAKS